MPTNMSRKKIPISIEACVDQGCGEDQVKRFQSADMAPIQWQANRQGPKDT